MEANPGPRVLTHSLNDDIVVNIMWDVHLQMKCRYEVDDSGNVWILMFIYNKIGGY